MDKNDRSLGSFVVHKQYFLQGRSKEKNFFNFWCQLHEWQISETPTKMKYDEIFCIVSAVTWKFHSLF